MTKLKDSDMIKNAQLANIDDINEMEQVLHENGLIEVDLFVGEDPDEDVDPEEE